MSNYQFTVILKSPPMTHKEILDATDALGEAGCTDASIGGHSEGMELLFQRAGDSLQAAISSAITDVEEAGFAVSKVELEREAIVAQPRVARGLASVKHFNADSG